ncbi:MAG: hypothetical protein QW291_06355 [Thermofilaceae archaeon]
MDEERECMYYKYTGNGTRCVFMPPEEWRLRHHSLKDYCARRGNGCPVLARILANASGSKFLSQVGDDEKNILGVTK